MSYYVVLLFGLSCTLLSCSEQETAPFTTGSKFVYAASYSTPDGRKIQYDTLSFTIQKRDITSYSLDIKKIKWENTRHDYYQYRGLNTKDGLVELQLPINYRGFDNELIAIPGHPTVSITGAPGYSLENEDKYVAGYGTLSGLTLKQQTKDLRDTNILFDGEMLSCRLLLSQNSSHIEKFGKYSVLYTYNPVYGFITLNYHYPDGKNIALRLIDIEIAGK